MTFARRPLLIAAVATMVAVVSGCTSSTAGTGTGSAVPSVPQSTSATAPAPSTPASTPPAAPSTPVRSTSAPPPAPSSTAVSSSPAPPTSPSTSSAAPVARSTCRSLMIRVLRGSAAPGFEFAALQFVNTGRTSCVLIGVPVVTLRLRDKTVGTASTPAGSATARYRLAPGAVAESALRDYSNCQAPLSDMIAVTAPGSTISSVRPGQLRACTLKTYPLTRPE